MASVWAELKRRNVAKVAVAYAIVGWLLVEIAATVLPIFEAPDWTLQVFTFFLILGFPIALILSWAYELTPTGVERTKSVPLSESIAHITGRKLDFVIIGLLALAVLFMFVDNYLPESGPFAGTEIDPASLETPTAAVEEVSESGPVIQDEQQREVLPNSVAVLLCDNLSPDPNDAYFAASIHDEILNQLVKIRDLNVIARTSVMQYAQAPPTISQIAEELNVEAVMECSVRYAGDAILVTAQLIDPATNSHLWSETYPGDLSDLSGVFAMQADIARNIAGAFQVEFSPSEQESIEKIPTESPEAYAYYLRALAAMDGELQVVDALLDQAIEADPEFASAYAQKAYWASFGLVGVSGAGPDAAAELENMVRSNAERALVLDPTLGIAQAALAVPHYANWRGNEAEEAFQRAIELSPNDVDVLVLYGRFKRYRGEFDEATRLLGRAVSLDPGTDEILEQLALSYRDARDWVAAASVYATVLNRRPDEVSAYIGSAYVDAGRGSPADAERLLRIVEPLVGANGFRLTQIAEIYSFLGQDEQARRVFDKLAESAADTPVGEAVWARAYLAVGDYDQALRHLETAVNDRVPTDFAILSSFAANSDNPVLQRPQFRDLLDGLWDE